MDIRNYSSFATVAELMSFTKAAERLHITQSALSRRIRGLEDYLDVDLFEKTGRNIRLTHEGEALFSKINYVLIADRELRTYAEELNGGKSGLLKVGICCQLIEPYMSSFLKSWTEKNPDIKVYLLDGGETELTSKLKDGSLHLTISSEPSTLTSPLTSRSLGRLSFLAVGKREFIGNHNGPIEISTLLQYPIMLLNNKQDSRQAFDAACRIESSTTPKIVLESHSSHTLLTMARGGNGIAIVPSSTKADDPSLLYKEVTLKGKPINFGICAMWSTYLPLPSYGRRFITSIERHIRSEQHQHRSRHPRALTS